MAVPFTGLRRQKASFAKNPVHHCVAEALGHLDKLHGHAAVLRNLVAGVQYEDKEVDDAIEAILPELELGKWTVDLVNALYARRLSRIGATEGPEALFHATNPFDTKPFDVKAPTLGTLPGLTDSARMEVCRRVLVREIIFAHLVEGEDGQAVVMQVCELANRAFMAIDILECSKEALDGIKELLATVQYLLTLGNFRHGLRFKVYVCCVSVFYFLSYHYNYKK
jgi:hypothetical protein